MPLLPGFEGDAGSRDKGTSIHYELLFIRKSLFHGPTALIPRLRCIISRPEDYISVCGLRTYETWPDKRLVISFFVMCFSSSYCMCLYMPCLLVDNGIYLRTLQDNDSG